MVHSIVRLHTRELFKAYRLVHRFTIRSVSQPSLPMTKKNNDAIERKSKFDTLKFYPYLFLEKHEPSNAQLVSRLTHRAE